MKALTIFLHMGFIFTATLVADKLHVENLHVKENNETIKTLTLSQPTQIPLKDTNLTLHVKDDNGKTIKKDITWIVKPLYTIRQNGTNVIVPLKDTNIKLKAKYKGIISNEINLHVKWIVSGHTLPPMPDEKINNSTLLGVDINNNGVRDDVERKIYKTYKRPIVQAYMMQFGKRFPKTLTNPKQAAKSQEIEQEMWRQYSCEGYLFMKMDIEIPKDSVEFMENAYFNTKARIKAYLEYNQALSGGVYSIPIKDDQKIENCDFNVIKLLEMEK
ncbi:MAG: hypothetical protein KGV58_00340 [Campylobacteraceae bacterium]|nr:hypothetical protein [Campylobacteraceae bacterium]